MIEYVQREPVGCSPSESQLLPEGTRVLVAGASGGIGHAVVNLLQSSSVVLGCHYHTRSENLRSQLTKSVTAKLFQGDLNRKGAPERLVQRFVHWAGGIDVMIQLCGGVERPTTWERITEAEWAVDLRLNLSVPFFLAREAMKYMRRGGGGRVLLTGTASARHGGGRTSLAYGAAKAGVECITKGLAREGAPFGILVNAVLPGFIDTDLHTRRMRRTRAQLRQRGELVPLKRAGAPVEVASVIVFLVSPQASYITGECVAVSGGDWL